MSDKDNNFSFKDGVSLKEYMDSKLNSLEKAVDVAKQELDRRLHGMNEFREQINKLEGTLVTRKELDFLVLKISDDKRALMALIISAASFFASIASVFLALLRVKS